MYDILELSKKLVPELREIARELKINKADTLKKQDLIYKILDQQVIGSTTPLRLHQERVKFQSKPQAASNWINSRDVAKGRDS